MSISRSIAGVPLAQLAGPEADRAVESARAHQRAESARAKAAAAAGVGPADGEDHHATAGDADGRLPWAPAPQPEHGPITPDEPLAKDPLGQRGELLDLSG